MWYIIIYIVYTVNNIDDVIHWQIDGTSKSAGDQYVVTYERSMNSRGGLVDSNCA